jgi:hypothetical protein
MISPRESEYPVNETDSQMAVKTNVSHLVRRNLPARVRSFRSSDILLYDLHSTETVQNSSRVAWSTDSALLPYATNR